jgi:ankyrin repeat protein
MRFKIIIILLAFAIDLESHAQQQADWKKDLVEAIRSDNTNDIAKILSGRPKYPDTELNENGITPLMVACRAGSQHVVEWLLLQGANPNAKTKIESGTALLGASDKGFLGVVQLLVEHGADVNHKDSRDWPPLIAALDQEHSDVAEYLINHGADVGMQLQSGRDALMIAGEKGATNLIHLLIKIGAKINHCDDGGNHALIDAASAGHAATVSLLLKEGAQIDRQNHDGWTALSQAAALGYCDVVKVLCDSGANLGLKNKFGRTALDYAQGITGTNNIATGGDITALVEKGLIADDEVSYVLARNGSGRDFNCIVSTLKAHKL